MPQIIKKIALWDFARASWQWDVLCLLIICFIFLTPKSWYANDRLIEPGRTVTLSADRYSADRKVLEAEVRRLSGDPEAEVLEARQKTDDKGQIVYEIDIR